MFETMPVQDRPSIVIAAWKEANAKPQQRAKSKVWVDEPTDNDVLLGKQRVAFNHVGNKKFRNVIWNQWETYNSSKGRCEWSAIVVSIFQYLITQCNVRFLSLDTAAKRWYIVDNDVAREKVGQAIRAAINFRRQLDRKQHCSFSKSVALRCLVPDKPLSLPRISISALKMQKTRKAYSRTKYSKPAVAPIKLGYRPKVKAIQLVLPIAQQPPQPSPLKTTVTIVRRYHPAETFGPMVARAMDANDQEGLSALEVQATIGVCAAVAANEAPRPTPTPVLDQNSAAMFGAFSVWASQTYAS